MKQKNYSTTIIILFFFINSFSQTPKYEWAHQSLRSCSLRPVISVGNDNAGNVYSCFNFELTTLMDLDPGPGIFTPTLKPSAFNTVVQKLSPNQNLIWAISFPGARPVSACVSKNGDIYVTGYFGDTVDFDPGPSVFNVVSITSYNGFIVKLDSTGSLKWVKQINLNYNDDTKIYTDVNDNVILLGEFRDTVDFNPGAGVYNLISSSAGNIPTGFILKLDSSANFIWVKSIVNNMNNRTLFGLTTDINGNIFTYGNFTAILDLDPGIGVANFNAANGNSFIQKLDTNGNFIWAKTFNSSANDFTFNNIITDSNGDLYLAGTFQGTTDLDPGIAVNNVVSSGKIDVFVAKFSNSGALLWGKSFGGLEYEDVRHIRVDMKGNIYLLGSFMLNVDFDFSSAVNQMNSGGLNYWSIYCLKIDKNSNFQWVVEIGDMINQSNQTTTDNFVFNVDQKDNIYTLGLFTGVIDFNPDPLIFTSMNSSTGAIFMQKLSQPNSIDGLSEKFENQNFQIYPNPTIGIVNINFTDGILYYEITDAIGKVIQTSKVVNNKTEVNLSEYDNGIYFVKVFNDNGEFLTKKIIKQ